MMENCTIIPSNHSLHNQSSTQTDYKILDLVLYVIYATQGLAIVVGGSAIAVAILTHAGLRGQKENLLVLGLTGFPIGDGLAYLFAAMYRIPILLLGRKAVPTTQFYCWLMPHNQMWTLFGTPPSLAMCAVSLDRLLLITYPLRYRSLGVGYGWAWVVGCFVHGLLFYVATFVQAWPTRLQPTQRATEICYSSMGRNLLLNSYQTNVIFVSSLASIGFFGIALFMYRKRVRSTMGDGNGGVSRMQQMQMQQERAMTLSFALSTFCTVLLYALPVFTDSLLSLFVYPNCFDCELLSVPLWIVANFNPLANIYIFLARHSEIRIGFWAAVKRKPMPYDVTTWGISYAA